MGFDCFRSGDDKNTKLRSCHIKSDDQILSEIKLVKVQDASFTDFADLISRFMIMATVPVYHPDGWWDDQNANLDIVKFCGFGKCPNRYAFITRPDVLHGVFDKEDSVFHLSQISKPKVRD